MKFKNKHSFEERYNESVRVLDKYPDRIPVICEKSTNCKMDDIDRSKYLIPTDLTVGQFIYVIRKRMKLASEKAIFLFINGKMSSSSSLLGQIYETDKDNDGFLYISYTDENVFG